MQLALYQPPDPQSFLKMQLDDPNNPDLQAFKDDVELVRPLALHPHCVCRATESSMDGLFARAGSRGVTTSTRTSGSTT